MKNQESKGYSDVVSDQDLFSISAYTEGLAKFIQTCSTPMTIAIQGNWGSGKTSMMKRIEKSINSTALCYTINTWQYSQFELSNQLSLVFLGCIINNIVSGKNDISERTKIATETLKKSFFSLAKLATPLIPVPIVSNLAGEVVKNFESALDKNETSAINAIDSIKDKFQSVIKSKLEEDNKYDRVVFFIDDLDRLEPKKAVELMEIMKVILECENCVFVLAIDYDVVVRGVKAKYGSDIDAKKARNFFDKIIQVPFSLPVGKYNVDNYIRDLLTTKKDGKEYTPYGLYSEDAKESISEVIRTTVGCNPRAIKRVINSYILLREINSIETKNSNDGYKTEDIELVIFASLCMQLAYEKMYDALLAVCDTTEGINYFFDSILQKTEETDTAYLDKIGYNNYSDGEKESLSSFLDCFIDCINKCANKDHASADTEGADADLNERSVMLLKEALKSSSSTSVNTTTVASVSVNSSAKIPEKFLQIYDVLVELGKANRTNNVTEADISTAKNIVADKRSVTQSAITDKTTRQLGINVSKFCEYVNDYYAGGDKLIKTIIEKNRDRAKEAVIIEMFESLRK